MKRGVKLGQVAQCLLSMFIFVQFYAWLGTNSSHQEKSLLTVRALFNHRLSSPCEALFEMSTRKQPRSDISPCTHSDASESSSADSEASQLSDKEEQDNKDNEEEEISAATLQQQVEASSFYLFSQ